MSGTLTNQSDAATVAPEVQHFLERMLEDAQIAPDNIELKSTMLGELAARLQQQLILDLLDKMPEAKFPEFERLMEGNPSSDRILAFLKVSVPTHADVVAHSMMNFKDNFVAGATA